MWIDQRSQKNSHSHGKTVPLCGEEGETWELPPAEGSCKVRSSACTWPAGSRGSAGLHSQGGAPGQTSGIPCRSRQVWEVRGGHLGRMQLQHCCCEKHIISRFVWYFIILEKLLSAQNARIARFICLLLTCVTLLVPFYMYFALQ